MVIAHLLNDDGGVGRVVETLCNAQINDGHTVYVVTSNGKQKFLEKLDPRVTVMLLSRNKRIPQILDGLKIRATYQRLLKQHPEETIVLHAHNLVSVGLSARLRNIPLVCTIHGLSKFPNAKDTLRSRLQTVSLGIIIRKILSAGGKVYGVSDHTSKHYAAVSGRNIDTIYNGTPEKTLNCSADKENFHIIHVGDISRAKGWDCSLMACAILKQRHPEMKLRYISAGRLCDIDEDDISRITSESGLSEDEATYLGFVKDLDRIYCDAQVLVLASDSEGLPMSILEAQSFGVPVIVTDVGGCSEAVESGVTGFLVDKSPSEIAEKLEVLATDQELWLHFSKNAKQIHKEKFSTTAMVDNYYRSYETIGAKYGIK